MSRDEELGHQGSQLLTVMTILGTLLKALKMMHLYVLKFQINITFDSGI